MTNPEFNQIDPMKQLKDAKYALNAGNAKKALDAAQAALQNSRERGIAPIEAMALHRIGSAFDALGFHGEAERHMGHGHTILEQLDTPDPLAQGIIERDLALLIAQRDRSEDGKAEAAEWHQRAIISHEIASNQTTAKARRVKLELATTAAFGHRLQALDNRYAHGNLWQDVVTLRDLRHHTKPAYELDAIDWATRYEQSPLKVVRALPRVAFLSMQVANPITPTRIATRPSTRLASNLLENL